MIGFYMRGILVVKGLNKGLCEVTCKIKNIRFLFNRNTYCHHTYLSGDLLREAPTLKVTWNFNHEAFWFWFSLTQFVGLKRKHLSRRRVLLLFFLNYFFRCNFNFLLHYFKNTWISLWKKITKHNTYFLNSKTRWYLNKKQI